MAGRAIVIGGGVVGLSTALGLAEAGMEVIVLDGDDADNRASYGNAGLIWVQSKGADHRPYALWSRRSALLWPGFARDLLETTGIDVELEQRGGFSFCLDETELEKRAAMVDRMAALLGADNDVEMVDARQLRERMPCIGSRVIGASWCPSDGHVNSLLVTTALRKRCIQLGVDLLTGMRATGIRMDGSHLTVDGAAFSRRADRVVVAAGLATQPIAAGAGMKVPLKPVRGQIVVTERIRPTIGYPTTTTRQVRAGSVMFGNSHEDNVGQPGTTLPVLSSLARRAMLEFPFLDSIRVLRCWGAIRVMPVDGKPIYARSRTCPGAYAVACHSGITLAAIHAGIVGPAIAAGILPPEAATFTEDRFDAASPT